MASSKSSSRMRRDKSPLLSLNLNPRLPFRRSTPSPSAKAGEDHKPDIEEEQPTAATTEATTETTAETNAEGGETRQNDQEPVLKAQRRSSTLGLLTSLIPSLISPSPDHPIHRKPVGAFPPNVVPDTTNLPPYQLPEIRHSTGLGISAPSEAPPPPPPKTAYDTDTHAQKHRAMPAVIQKHRKTPSSGPPPPQQPPPFPPAQPSNFQFTETPSSPNLHKKNRSSSAQPSPTSKEKHSRLQSTRRPSPSPEPRGRSTSAHPPPSRGSQLEAPPLPPSTSRPSSQQSSDGNQSPVHGESRGRLRRSWMPGGRSRSNSHDLGRPETSGAWIISSEKQAEYNTAFLLNGDKVPELWNEQGAIYVYLYPKGSGHGPSFKVPAQTVSSSRVFAELIDSDTTSMTSSRSRARSFGGRDSLSAADAHRHKASPPTSPPLAGSETPGESRLYIPAVPRLNGQMSASNQPPILDRLISVRNLFAFLTGQPLVGTRAHPTIFAVFLQISALLREFDFLSFDGTSFGEAADMSFSFFIGQLGLGDVRHSREKTLEALVLAERMRSWDLYNEAFTHAVGKYAAILDIKSPLFDKLSSSTRQRLERAHLDLLSRQHNVNMQLEDFGFPGLFAGIASSTSNPMYKDVRFKNWKNSFARMRSFVISYYKSQFGHWPPKARSKKNSFSESGLNRLVLRILYSDLCSLYDLLVDRESVTPRVIDESPDDISPEELNPEIAALRKMLSEFDHSSPPVLPPVPFDIPKIPTMSTILATYDELQPKDQARFDKKIQSHELLLILHKAYNFDTDNVKTPFLTEFKEFELKEAKGKFATDMADNRVGYWLFLYVVLQSLPMLVVDAPGLRFTESVEYFLCEPPQGNLPWLEDAGEVRKAWYQIPGQGGIVELSADVVMFSVEAVYQRSHCWLAAKNWEVANGVLPPVPNMAPPPPVMSPLEAPRAVFEDMDPMQSPPALGATGPSPPPGSTGSLPPRGRDSSSGPSFRGAGHPYRSSIVLGLEPVPFPEGVPGSERSSRIVSQQPRHGSRGSIPDTAAMSRSRSAGNLRGMMNESPGSEPKDRQGSVGGSTFDDILKNMDGQKKQTKKKFF